MSNLITKKSSLEEDTEFLQALLTDLNIKFRRLVGNLGTHGQQCGLRMRGSIFQNEYEKVNKKYLHGAYPLVAGVIKDLAIREREV